MFPPLHEGDVGVYADLKHYEDLVKTCQELGIALNQRVRNTDVLPGFDSDGQSTMPVRQAYGYHVGLGNEDGGERRSEITASS